jgi:hypothetical protein
VPPVAGVSLRPRPTAQKPTPQEAALQVDK